MRPRNLTTCSVHCARIAPLVVVSMSGTARQRPTRHRSPDAQFMALRHCLPSTSYCGCVGATDRDARLYTRLRQGAPGARDWLEIGSRSHICNGRTLL